MGDVHAHTDFCMVHSTVPFEAWDEWSRMKAAEMGRAAVLEALGRDVLMQQNDCGNYRFDPADIPNPILMRSRVLVYEMLGVEYEWSCCG